jgi:phosphatidylinositol alpha-1,6-mannosyltransferase
VTKTLFITNDFPPRPGGIQTFVYEIVRRFEPSQVSVLTSSWAGDAQFDALHDFEVVRAKTQMLLPTKKTFALAKEIIERNQIEQVIFGASAPLGLLAGPLRKLGIKKIVAFTHGHEVGWAKTPVTKQLLRKISNEVDVLTYLTEYTKNQILKGLPKSAAAKMHQLLPAVDSQQFNTSNRDQGNELRTQIGFADRPVIVSVSRLMARKGHDQLIKTLPKVQEQIPGAALVIVGEGPYRNKLEKLVSHLSLEQDVHFTGKVPFADLPKWYAVGDIFAMPCRTRSAGWDVEGLGIVYLEASATGLPVIAGDSGGAPEAVESDQSGYVVSGTNQDELVNRIVQLLADAQLRDQMGQFGRNWVQTNWTWENTFAKLNALISH